MLQVRENDDRLGPRRENTGADSVQRPLSIIAMPHNFGWIYGPQPPHRSRAYFARCLCGCGGFPPKGIDWMDGHESRPESAEITRERARRKRYRDGLKTKKGD
jgi:hypothetical protein